MRQRRVLDGVLAALAALALVSAGLALNEARQAQRCELLLETAVAANVHHLSVTPGRLLADWEGICG